MATSATDNRFLILCEEVKETSHDPHRRVGVVIVGEGDTVLSTGSNSPPAAFELSRSETYAAIADDPKWKYFMLEHAERNAINAARDHGVPLVGATMYGTLFPCADCARAIVSAGIARLVVSNGDQDRDRDEKWRDHYIYARKIFELGNVSIEIHESSRQAEAS